jgi:hypothetical protein
MINQAMKKAINRIIREVKIIEEVVMLVPPFASLSCAASILMFVKTG